MRAKVYVETTVASYLTSRPTRNLLVAAHQEITREWWEKRSEKFELYISDAVVDEASRGDRLAATKRLERLAGVKVLTLDQGARALAARFVGLRLIPAKAAADAVHLAVATSHGMEFLLTWNCRHLANAEVLKSLSAVCEDLGYIMPVVCTPEQLMGD